MPITNSVINSFATNSGTIPPEIYSSYSNKVFGIIKPMYLYLMNKIKECKLLSTDQNKRLKERTFRNAIMAKFSRYWNPSRFVDFNPPFQNFKELSLCLPSATTQVLDVTS